MPRVVPEVLKRLREDKGWTQEQLAERAKINKQTVSRLERGSCADTRPRVVDQLSRALKVEHAVLIGEAPAPLIGRDGEPVDPKIESTVRIEPYVRNALHL